MRRPFGSLRARLVAAMLGLAVVAVAVCATASYLSVLRETEAIFDYHLRQMALSLRDQGPVPDAARAALAGEPIDYIVQIWTADGARLYASRPTSPLPPVARLGFADMALDGRPWRVFSILAPGRLIQVGQPLSVRRELAADAAWRSAVPLLGLLLPLAAVAAWLVNLTLAPLRRATAEVQRRDADDLSPLDVRAAPAELAPLVGALDALLARLARAFDAQRRFVADAAHELRSPLTALTLQLERLRGAPDDAARRDATDAMGAGVERARRLVEQMLALARSEPGALPGDAPRDVDLAEVARQAVADAVPLALDRGVTLSMETDEDAMIRVRGDAQALRGLVRNLVDNAVRHGRAGGTVRVDTTTVDDAPVLVVEDDGPGIPPAERARVFDRFHRGEGAGGTGSGLGLSIVRAVADRHGARVELDDAVPAGLRVTVRFPVPANGDVDRRRVAGRS